MARKSKFRHNLGVPVGNPGFAMRSGEISHMFGHDLGIVGENHSHIRYSMHKHGIHRHR